LIVNYVTSTENADYINVCVTFENPSSIGCGDGVEFHVSVTDDQSNLLTDGTTTQTYDGTVSQYVVVLSRVQYAAFGYINVWLGTSDTNGRPEQQQGSTASIFFASTKRGTYVDVISSSTDFTFSIVSESLLLPGATLVTPGLSPSLRDWITTPPADGTKADISVETIVVANVRDTYKYTITLHASGFDLVSFPDNCVVIVANAFGSASYQFPVLG
jgi:hypothetical protein